MARCISGARLRVALASVKHQKPGCEKDPFLAGGFASRRPGGVTNNASTPDEGSLERTMNAVVAASRPTPPARRPAPDPLTWAPPVSAPNFPMTVTLGSFHSQRAFREGFARGQIAFNQLMSYLPFVVTSEDFTSIKTIVEEKISALESEMGDEIKRLDAILAAEDINIDQVPKSFTAPVTMTVPLYTPEARRLLALTVAFDDLCWRLEVLRFNEMIRPDARTALHNRWKKIIMGLPREMGELWNRARNSLQRQRAERNASRRTMAESESKALPENLDETLKKVDSTMAELSEGAAEAMSDDAELGDAMGGSAAAAA